MRDHPTVPNRPDPVTVPTRRPPGPAVPPPFRPAAPVRPLERTRAMPLPEPTRRRPVAPLPAAMPLPLLLPVLGASWWAYGSAALETGIGTFVLALGLGATVTLGVALRRRFGRGVALRPDVRRQVLKATAITVAAVMVGAVGLGLLGLGEIGVPLTCAIVGFWLFALVPLLDERTMLALGGALLVLATVGAVMGLGSQGDFYAQGVVGLVAGALCWAAAAIRGGLVADLLVRVRS